MYDLVIVGGGPGGVAAGIYAARKKIKAALITKDFGGQSVVSLDIQNWIGTPSISGFDLAKNLEAHVRAQDGLTIIDGDLAVSVEKKERGFLVTTENGQTLETKTILVCSGSHHKKLNVPGEDQLNGRGVAYCSTCDAPLFSGKTVAVVGAGNAGLEAVRDLLHYASKVYMLVRTDKVRGDALTFDTIKQDPKVEIIYFAQTQEILGKETVTGIKYLNTQDNQVRELPLDGVFVEIGSAPNSDFLGTLVEKTPAGEIVVNPLNQQTSQSGIWAAGDVTMLPYRQNNISAGDAVKALLNIQDYLRKGS